MHAARQHSSWIKWNGTPAALHSTSSDGRYAGEITIRITAFIRDAPVCQRYRDAQQGQFQMQVRFHSILPNASNVDAQTRCKRICRDYFFLLRQFGRHNLAVNKGLKAEVSAFFQHTADKPVLMIDPSIVIHRMSCLNPIYNGGSRKRFIQSYFSRQVEKIKPCCASN